MGGSVRCHCDIPWPDKANGESGSRGDEAGNSSCDGESVGGYEAGQLFSITKPLIDGLVDESSEHLACAHFDSAAFGCDVAWDWRGRARGPGL